MDSPTLYLLAADAILALHVLFVLFVISGLLLIFAGKFAGWSWVRNRVFRIAHLATIGIVVLQSWFGVICPLTTLEMWLRARAGGTTYAGSFIGSGHRYLLIVVTSDTLLAIAESVYR